MKTKIAKGVVSLGWTVSVACTIVGGRILWFGLTPETPMFSLITDAVTGIAFMVGGIAVGLTGNGIAYVLK